MNESQYNPNRLMTPAAVKLELISEIQASLNAIDKLKQIEPFWLFEVRIISAAGTLV